MEKEEPEVSVQSLLEKIKKEGVEAAEKEAEKILEDARKRASSIVEDAEEQARKKLDEARAEVEKNQQAFESSMSQAARNLILAVKNDIIRLCERILEQRVGAAMTPEAVKEMLVGLTESWGQKGEVDLEILMGEEDLKELEDMLLGELRENIREGITLRPVDRMDEGFRIGERDGSMYYDFTPEGLAAVLSAYLNPRIAKYLEEAARREQEVE